MDRRQMLSRIREAGVIGAGGAGFPTYVKLQSRVDHIIANGAECEPLLQKDREVLLHEQEALFDGLAIMRRLTGAKHVTIALKTKNQDVAEAYDEPARALGYRVFVCQDVYPAGDEFALVYEVTGRRVSPGGIPLSVGCLVNNVETIVNVSRAAAGKPVTEKYVTVTGAVRSPVTTVVPVGTSLQDCIAAAGGCTVDNPVVLTGGVMMGGVAADLSHPVSKTVGGLIVLPADHHLVRRKTTEKATYTRIGHGQCDQCSLCTELCPRYILGYPIEPHRVMRTLLMTGQEKERGSLWAQFCCECNVCSLIACPEQLDPKSICVDAKKILRDRGVRRTDAELDRLFRDPHPARKGREIPIATLHQRLGLKPYDRKPQFVGATRKPQSVAIPLDSHVGQPATPIVKEGDVVRCGDVVATADPQQLGCPVHASIDGRVRTIGRRRVEIST
jgi:Na+-translocating ferredoxin:NAD+ oxidoreductase RnfC subunit